jgi:hypothetical protein
MSRESVLIDQIDYSLQKQSLDDCPAIGFGAAIEITSLSKG